MANYEFKLSDVRASESKGRRYATVRAIANGTDTYNSVFTESARKSIITQIMDNAINSKFLHADTVWGNIESYLDTRASSGDKQEREIVQKLRGQLPMTKVPVGKAIDAKFVDDRTVEVTIEESAELKELGKEEAQYINGVWNAIQKGVIKGVSVVFDNVKSFSQKGKEMINDLTLIGLDFVDKASHKDTRVLDVFVRAAAENLEEPEEQIEKGKEKMTEAKDVDALVDKAVEQKMAQQKQAEDAKLAQDSLVAKQEELEAQRKELEEKNQALEQEKQALEAEKSEAITLAEDAVKKAQELSSQVASRSNPHFEAAKKQQEDESDPYANMSLRDLIKAKAQNQYK